MNCICFSIARQIKACNIYPAPVQTHRKLQWSWVRFLVDLLACVAVLSVSFRLSETCAKDPQGKKEKTKPCFKIYILCIIRVDATVYSSVHWLKAAVTSPTWDGHHDWSDLVETMAWSNSTCPATHHQISIIAHITPIDIPVLAAGFKMLVAWT